MECERKRSLSLFFALAKRRGDHSSLNKLIQYVYFGNRNVNRIQFSWNGGWYHFTFFHNFVPPTASAVPPPFSFHEKEG